MKWNKRIGAVCFIGALTAAICGAQQKDIPNSTDHPLVTRYPGSVIVEYSYSEFDEVMLPLGKVNRDDVFEKIQRLEGKVTRIGYEKEKFVIGVENPACLILPGGLAVGHYVLAFFIAFVYLEWDRRKLAVFISHQGKLVYLCAVVSAKKRALNLDNVVFP